MRDRSHACFGKKRLEKIKFRTFTKRVGPRILSLESVEQTCGKPYLQKLETEDRSDKRGGAGRGGGGAFVLLLSSRSNARCSYECWEVFRWRLAFDHGAFHLCALIVTFVNVSLALVYTKAKQVVLPDT